MRPGHDVERKRGCGRALVLLLGAATLAGCSSITGAVSSDEPPPSFSSRVMSFFSGAKPGLKQPASPTPSAPEVECPGVDIRGGASTLNIAAKADQATAGDLRYQLSFGQTARECLVQGGTMKIKVGVQGRIVLGPLGGPGQLDVPVRYAVVREGPEPRTIVTRFKRIPVVVPPDQMHVQFVDIEEGLTFPMPSSGDLEAYVVYVGFDEIGDRNEKRPPAKGTKRPAQRQQ
jgi:hypothetical protein